MELSDEQISRIWDAHTVPVFGKTGINPIVFARAIESAVRKQDTATITAEQRAYYTTPGSSTRVIWVNKDYRRV